MILVPLSALALCGRIISVAVILQTVELFIIRSTFVAPGIWDWQILRREYAHFPKLVRSALDATLSADRFRILLGLQLCAALLFLVSPRPQFVFVMLLCSFLTSVRWRGAFNGGSDYMTLLVLTGVAVGLSFKSSPSVVLGCLLYLGLQSCISYFIAGVVKLRGSEWRDGSALGAFVNSTIYSPTSAYASLASKKPLLLCLSWLLIVFECSFPVALLHPQLCLLYIGVGIGFHCGAAYVFGLNRFILAWAATYPALYVTSVVFEVYSSG